MSLNLFNQNRWLKFLSTGTFSSKTHKYLGQFIHVLESRNAFVLINWTKLGFFFKYSFQALKNCSNDVFSLLLVADTISLGKTMSILANSFNLFFSSGAWEGGRLTKILWYKYVPSFIICFGMLFPKNLSNELKVLGIPSINLTSQYNFKKIRTNTYLIPFFSKKNSSNKNFIALFSYCLLKIMPLPYTKVFLTTQTVNPFYKQMTKMIEFKTNIFPKLIEKIQKIIYKKQIVSIFNLFIF
jgi:hypothetical protein